MLRPSIVGLGPIIFSAVNGLPANFKLDAGAAGLIDTRLGMLSHCGANMAKVLQCGHAAGQEIARYLMYVACSYERVRAAAAAATGLCDHAKRTLVVMNSAGACINTALKTRRPDFQCGSVLCPICRSMKMVKVLDAISAGAKSVKVIHVPLVSTNGVMDVESRYRPPVGTAVTLRTLQLRNGVPTSTNYAFGASRGAPFSNVIEYVSHAGVPIPILQAALTDPIQALQYAMMARTIGFHAVSRKAGRQEFPNILVTLCAFPELPHVIDGLDAILCSMTRFSIVDPVCTTQNDITCHEEPTNDQ